MVEARGRGEGNEKATPSKQDAEVSFPCLTHDENMLSSDAEIDILPSSSGGRRRQIPAQFGVAICTRSGLTNHAETDGFIIEMH